MILFLNINTRPLATGKDFLFIWKTVLTNINDIFMDKYLLCLFRIFTRDMAHILCHCFVSPDTQGEDDIGH